MFQVVQLIKRLKDGSAKLKPQAQLRKQGPPHSSCFTLELTSHQTIWSIIKNLLKNHDLKNICWREFCSAPNGRGLSIQLTRSNSLGVPNQPKNILFPSFLLCFFLSFFFLPLFFISLLQVPGQLGHWPPCFCQRPDLTANPYLRALSSLMI